MQLTIAIDTFHLTKNNEFEKPLPARYGTGIRNRISEFESPWNSLAVFDRFGALTSVAMSEWKDMIKISTAALPANDQSIEIFPDDFTVGDADIDDLQKSLDAAHLSIRNEITGKVLKYKQALISSSDRRYTALLDNLRSDKERLVKDNGVLYNKVVDIQRINELLDETNQVTCSNIIQLFQRRKTDELVRLFMQKLKSLRKNTKYHERLAAFANYKRLYQLKKLIFNEFYKYSVNLKYTKRLTCMKRESEQSINALQLKLEEQERSYQQRITEDKILYDRERHRHVLLEEELKSKVLDTLSNLKLDALSVFASTDNAHIAATTHEAENIYNTPIKRTSKNVISDESPSSVVVLGASSVNNTPKSTRSSTITVANKRIIGRK